MKKQHLILILLISINSKAQDLKSELGIITGLTSMQTDYGERGHFGSSYANTGFGSGGVYYLSFDNIRKRWNDKTTNLKDHIRLRIELSYMQANMIHRGRYTQGNSSFTKKYNAMKGKSQIFNYGLQFEYTLFNISDQRTINPYVSAGFLGNANTPKLESTLGDIKTNTNLVPSVYDNGIHLDKNNSTAIILGIGTRMRPKSYNNKSIYLIDFRWQRFNSDNIEGLTPQIDGNKFNDWLLFISIGYIFNIN